MTSADVVIVGGGAVGVSAAYHLAAAGAGRVMLLERADAVGTGSTGACAGGFRHQFSSRINIELSLASVPMIVGFSQEHGLPLDVVRDGYLFLVRSEAEWASFRAAAELQRSLGVDAQLLTPEGAAEIAPGIALDGLAGATFCPTTGSPTPAGSPTGTRPRRAVPARRSCSARTSSGIEVQGGRAAGGSHADGPDPKPMSS